MTDTTDAARQLITPRTLRGFNDMLPEEAAVRTVLLRRIEDTFVAHGFQPIATPALEYLEILEGKGGEQTDKEMFEFEDKGGRWVAMRYDLTVPLARFVAEHEGKLRFPFRAAQLGYVWRGDRPQRGRYRELIQCDADVIGATGPVVDAEILVLIRATLAQLGIGDFRIRVNDRRLLDALFEGAGIQGESTPVLRAIDKLEKIGTHGVEQELAGLGLTPEMISAVLDFVALGSGAGVTLDDVAPFVAPYGSGGDALEALAEMFDLVEAVPAAPGSSVALDPSIARGLDYYTGIVYETMLVDEPELGSISSGGRYDDLAGLFTKTHLPGVGGSIGLSRIMGVLAERDLSGLDTRRPLVMVVTPPDSQLRMVAMRLAADVRAGSDLRVEVYPGQHSHKRQMKYANAKGARFVLTIDDPDSIVVKDMESGESTVSTPAEVPGALHP